MPKNMNKQSIGKSYISFCDKEDDTMKIILRGWGASPQLDVTEVLGGDLIIPKEEFIPFLEKVGKEFDAFEVVVEE